MEVGGHAFLVLGGLNEDNELVLIGNAPKASFSVSGFAFSDALD